VCICGDDTWSGRLDPRLDPKGDPYMDLEPDPNPDPDAEPDHANGADPGVVSDCVCGGWELFCDSEACSGGVE